MSDAPPSPLEATARAIAAQARADGLVADAGGAAGLTGLLFSMGLADPALRPAAPTVARLLAHLLTPAPVSPPAANPSHPTDI